MGFSSLILSLSLSLSYSQLFNRVGVYIRRKISISSSSLRLTSPTGTFSTYLFTSLSLGLVRFGVFGFTNWIYDCLALVLIREIAISSLFLASCRISRKLDFFFFYTQTSFVNFCVLNYFHFRWEEREREKEGIYLGLCLFDDERQNDLYALIREFTTWVVTIALRWTTRRWLSGPSRNRLMR